MAYHNYQLSQPYNEKVHSLNVMKKRLPKLAVKNYNTVRLLDYLEERQKLREQPSYMFAKHSTTPWFQNDFYSRSDQLSFQKNELDRVTNDHREIIEENLQRKKKMKKNLPDISPASTPKSRECRKSVITPMLDYDRFSDKQIFSPFNYNWSVQSRFVSSRK